MKRSLFTAVAGAVLALSLAACGGSSSSGDTTGTTTTTPAATSAAAKSMMIDVVQYTQQTMTQAFSAMGGAAQVVKTDDPAVNCSAVSQNNVTCTISDAQGGSCTANMTLNESDPMFTLTMNCDNFHPDSGTLVDGAYTVNISVNEAALQGSSMDAKSAFGLAKTDSSDDCTLDPTEDWPSECTDADSETCSTTAAALYMTYLVGPGDLTVVDSCGTYVIGNGTTMSTAVCGDMNGEIFLISFTLDGTFNGDAVSADFNMNCDFSSVS